MSGKKIKGGDFFCGMGGFTKGFMLATAEMETAVEDFIAVNCNPRAIESHSQNHPEVRHFCRRLEMIRAEDAVPGGRLHVLLASPECTHHSIARGGKPMSDQSRAGAWNILDWASKLYIDLILIENVKEFRDWGPLGTNGRPLKSKKGETYRNFLSSLRNLGYEVEDRLLNAADFGDATSRVRLFIQARRKGKIRWPEPSHTADADDIFGKPRHRAAREIIDWTLASKSIYDRKRPLSEKTMRRIMVGLQKFGLKPFITPGQGERVGQVPRTHPVEVPVPTVAAQGHLHLVEPFIVRLQHNNAPDHIGKPLGTVLANGTHFGLAQPFLVKVAGSEDRPPQSVENPLPTVTAGGVQHAVVQPFLVETCHAGERPAKSIDDPVPTITCAHRGELALCEPFILPTQSGENRARDIGRLLQTITCDARSISLITPALLPQQSGGALRPVSEPTPTVSTSGAIGLVEPFLIQYYGTADASSVDDPLSTVTTKDRFGLVRPTIIINGEKYTLDIRFRMLQPRELAAAQGFPADYIITGNKTEQVRQIGNAVPVNLAKALVMAAMQGIAA